MRSYFGCHNHTEYSNLRLLDCINKPVDLINKARELGLSGIAITDHECISAHVIVNKIAKQFHDEGIDFTVALGNEIYLVDERVNGQKYYHFILIAKDAIGHKMIRELSSTAWYNSYVDRVIERVPTLKSELKETIQKYGKGHLIATSACIGGELSSNALIYATTKSNEAGQNIQNFINLMLDLFGEDFYIECAPSNKNDQMTVNTQLYKIAQVYNIKMVVGTDAHYLTAADRQVHKAYLNSKNGEREVDDFYEFAHLMDSDEVENLLAPCFPAGFVNTILDNTEELRNKIQFFDLFHKQNIPTVAVKDYPKKDWGELSGPDVNVKFKDAYPHLAKMFNDDDIQNRYWVNQCFEKLLELDKCNNTYLTELEEEARVKTVIGEKLETNMFCYPNTLQHYIDMIWDCGSMVGAGRGSSCAALNHYLMGITQLDPIEWNLPFFRYMNDERTELGDIDIDICPSKRPEILRRIREERGHMFVEGLPQWAYENLGCTLVATFGTEGTKSAILTACFKKGQLVLTKNGKKPIEKLNKEDFVYTTDGWQKINELTYLDNKEIIKIINRNSTDKEIYCTPDHEFLTISKEHKGRVIGKFNKTVLQSIWPDFAHFNSTDTIYQRYYGYFRDIDPAWKAASQITKNDYGLKRIDLTVNNYSDFCWYNSFGTGISEKIPINNDFCELIGIYLAEGSSNGNSITFTINKNELALKNRIIKLMWNVFQLDNVSIFERKDSQALNITYTSKQLIAFFEQLFHTDNIQSITQWNKFIPDILLHIQPTLQLQLFKGWFLGDGYARTSENGIRQSDEAKGTTVSKQLADDIIFILNRNFLNPTVIVEKRKNKSDVYNIMLYSDKARILYHYKYKLKTFDKELIIPFEARYDLDIPVIYNNNFYLKTKIELEENYTEKPQKVYCIQVDSQNFTLGDTIVHNCRGYRSDDYPDGIDVDEAQYMASLIPQERGFLWSLSDVINGNDEKNRKPVTTFINEVKQYPGLLEVIQGIEGIVNKRSSHASGVIFYDGDPFSSGAFMKTPKGELITAYDLHDAEYVGQTKYDLLVTEVQDKLVQAIQLMQIDKVIEPELSLREVYDKYFHPSILPLNDNKIWDALGNVSVLNTFQFDSMEGSKVAKKLKPRTVQEMSSANGLMRLMGEEGEKRPLDKYAEQKEDISLWYAEMTREGLTLEEESCIEPYFKADYGVPPDQESLMLMLMDKNICHFNLAEANAARKIVGKKQMSKIPELKKKVLEQASSPLLGQYIWKHGVGPQLGYSFSRIHALAYSFIGVQTLYIATHWNPIYWNTACLIVNSGATDPENSGSTDYAKLAKALGEIMNAGIKIGLPDINTASYGFKPDVKNNQIMYGLKAMLNVGDDVIENTIANRPYVSMRDYLNRVSPNKQAMVSLIKSGAFDNLIDRKIGMGWYIWETCDKKGRLTLQNMPSLFKYNLVPEDTEEMKFARRVYEFNRYLKVMCKGNATTYKLDERAITFLINNNKESFIQDNNILTIKTWDNYYQTVMDTYRNWIAENKEQILQSLNETIFLEDWNKYATGTISAWEMEALCFYYHEHELAHLNLEKYGFDDFFQLPQNPEIDRTFEKGGKTINIFKLHKICGTCIAKNKTKSTISLLTTSGVVTVKFRKEYFVLFDKQISARGEDGKKHVIEKSWFNRGSMLVITGIRSEDNFVSKKYASANTHQLYKIDEVKPNGDIVIRHDRMQGEMEDGE